MSERLLCCSIMTPALGRPPWRGIEPTGWRRATGSYQPLLPADAERYIVLRLPSVLTPQAHLRVTASPLGPALRRQSLVAIRVDGAPLEMLDCKVDGDNGQRVIIGH